MFEYILKVLQKSKPIGLYQIDKKFPTYGMPNNSSGQDFDENSVAVRIVERKFYPSFLPI